MNFKVLWYMILFSVMVVWGLNVVAIKILVQHFPPITMQALRVLIAGIVILMILVFQKSLRKLTKRELLYTLGSGLFGVLGHHFFIGIGLVNTTASNGALILGLIPLVTSLLAVIFLKEKLTSFRIIGYLLGFVGVSFIIIQGNGSVSGVSIGDIYMLGAVVTQAISFIFIKKATRTLDSKLMTATMILFGSTLLLGISQFMEPAGITTFTTTNLFIWFVFISSAVFATGIGHMLYNTAIHHLGAAETSIFINLTTFFSLIGSALFLGETIKAVQIYGFVIIVIGVIFGTGTVDYYLNKRKSKATSVVSAN